METGEEKRLQRRLDVQLMATKQAKSEMQVKMPLRREVIL
jgi:hypothetical protein